MMEKTNGQSTMIGVATNTLSMRSRTRQRLVKPRGICVLVGTRLLRWSAAYLISVVVGLFLGQMTLITLFSVNESGLNDGVSQLLGIYTSMITEASSGEFWKAFLNSLVSTIIFTFVPVLIIYAAVTSSGWTARWRFGPVFALVPMLFTVVVFLVLNPPGVLSGILLSLCFVPALAIAGFVFGWLLGPEDEW